MWETLKMSEGGNLMVTVKESDGGRRASWMAEYRLMKYGVSWRI